jgi:NMD protein affecting ribosome stability and mRNA decay
VTQKRRGHYSRSVQNVTCPSCGKLTRADVGESTGLCAKCYREAGAENMHSDNGHTGPVETCPECGPYFRTGKV